MQQSKPALDWERVQVFLYVVKSSDNNDKPIITIECKKLNTWLISILGIREVLKCGDNIEDIKIIAENLLNTVIDSILEHQIKKLNV